MRRRDFITLVGSISLTGCVNTKSRRLTKASNTAVDAWDQRVPDLMAQFNIPGASIACVQEGSLAWSRHFGVKDAVQKSPVDHDTLFEAASVSKTVFAYAALKLCEQGVIGLDTPLVRYTPLPFSTDPRINRITPRHLLSHSSGLAEWRSHQGPLIQTQPGSAFQYSGEGYYYLQSTITTLLGKVDPTQCARYEADLQVCATDFDAFMKQRLLRPFGMTASGYAADQSWTKNLARPHDEAGKPVPKAPPRGSDIARYGAVGGLNVSATDYAKFLIELLTPKAPDEFRLGPALLREMVQPQIRLLKQGQIDGCNAWGLGWGIQERPKGNLLVHSGGQSGFRALALACLGTRAGLVILTNSDNGAKLISHPDILNSAERIVTGA